VNLWSVLNGPMRFGTNDTLRYTITANGEHLYPASSYLNMGTTAGSDGYGIRDNAGTMQYKHSSGSWVNMNVASQLYTSGTSIWITVGEQSQSSQFVSTTVNSNPVHGLLFGNQGSGPSVGGLISVANNGTGTSLGANLYYIAGTSGGEDNRGGSHYFDPGDGSGTARSGNVAFMTTSVSDWQGMGRGIAIGNADTEPIAGLVDCNALYSFDFEGTSELFAYNEEGGKVGITFVEPI